MNHEIELFVHTDHGHEPKLVKVRPDITVEDLLKTLAPEGHTEYHLFLEEDHEPKHHHHRLCDCEVHHRKHVHCHRCRHIHVSVFFNGEITRNFSPSATIGRVLAWALKEFKLTGADATNKALRLPDRPNETLPETAHVGSFAKAPECSVRFELTDAIKFNG